MKTQLTAAAILALMTTPALADHGNPWATADDVVLSKNHDANQLQSVGTPGEDEMKGRLMRSGTGPSKSAGRTGAGRGNTSGKQGGRGAGRK